MSDTQACHDSLAAFLCEPVRYNGLFVSRGLAIEFEASSSNSMAAVFDIASSETCSSLQSGDFVLDDDTAQQLLSEQLLHSSTSFNPFNIPC